MNDIGLYSYFCCCNPTLMVLWLQEEEEAEDTAHCIRTSSFGLLLIEGC